LSSFSLSITSFKVVLKNKLHYFSLIFFLITLSFFFDFLFNHIIPISRSRWEVSADDLCFLDHFFIFFISSFKIQFLLKLNFIFFSCFALLSIVLPCPHVSTCRSWHHLILLVLCFLNFVFINFFKFYLLIF